MQASDGGFGLVPYSSYVASTPALPAFYWDVYSSEQRIKEMCKELCKLASYGTYLAATIDRIQAVSPEEFAEYQQEMRETIASLRTEIYELSVGVMSWNVQHGKFMSSTQAQRDMFNDLAVCAITVKTLNSLDMTVKDLADCGLNVRGLAVMSYRLVEKFDMPEGFISGDSSIISVSQAALAKAETAVETANAANTAATKAVTEATAAQAKAEKAVETANAANTAANAAQAYVQDALVHLTRAEYDALTTKVDTTIYLVG